MLEEKNDRKRGPLSKMTGVKNQTTNSSFTSTGGFRKKHNDNTQHERHYMLPTTEIATL